MDRRWGSGGWTLIVFQPRLMRVRRLEFVAFRLVAMAEAAQSDSLVCDRFAWLAAAAAADTRLKGLLVAYCEYRKHL